MLIELGIRNFAIIDELRISFDRGLTALTGETGAGKSIIIDALGAVLGDRIGADVVRTGATAAHVEAVFALDDPPVALAEVLSTFGIEPDDGTLILARQITSSGRSTGRINGTTVTIAQLNQVGSLLIDIHGQSDHLKLLRPGDQLDALDHFAATIDLRTDIGDRVRELRAIRERRERIRGGEREREQRIDLLRYQLDEIVGAGIEAGEDERVERERAILMNAERLITEASSALMALEGADGGGATAALAIASQAVQHVAGIDSSQADMVERANELSILATELASDLRRYIESVDVDLGRLSSLDDRLDLLRGLKRKYGPDLVDVLQFGETAQTELDSLTAGGQTDESLAAQEAEILAVLHPILLELSTRREDAAVHLEQRIDDVIADLGLGSAQVRVGIHPLDDPTETGAERIELLFAPNAGETQKPLARIASGGETARLMLALKSVLAEGDETPTLVFDEIDVGVGARSGQAVGEKLWSLSSRHQVIVITHLAQIAAFADSHFMIRKAVADGRTESRIDHVVGEKRRDEIAEMIDGKPVSPESRAAADQLLARIAGVKGTQIPV